MANDNGAVKESVIRMMTRLATEHNAVNLSQGFPNEGPPWEVRLALAYGVLEGKANDHGNMDASSIKKALIDMISSDDVKHMEGKIDQLNQYSPPMGRPDLRQAISKYYERFYNYQVSSDDITVTLGATEAFASALRTIGRPGDKCVVIEPFHELYPSQCGIFYLEPVFVTLRESHHQWELNFDELEEALKISRLLLLNSPHNPTGKVFTRSELKRIVDLCIKYDVYIVTDEIYEHMIFSETPHFLLPKEFPEIYSRTLICNSLGKSAFATGWRLGWCLHPPDIRESYRGIHDQMAVMSPQPMQFATLTYLQLPDSYFSELSKKYEKRVNFLAEILKAAGFKLILPEGAYYLFVNYKSVPIIGTLDSMQACLFLLEKVGIACVPGRNFYGNKDSKEASHYLRFAACRSDADLAEAGERLKRFISSEN